MHKLLYRDNNRTYGILHSLGGVGKAQLAIACARRHKKTYTAIFWLSDNNEDSLRAKLTGRRCWGVVL